MLRRTFFSAPLKTTSAPTAAVFSSSSFSAASLTTRNASSLNMYSLISSRSSSTTRSFSSCYNRNTSLLLGKFSFSGQMMQSRRFNSSASSSSTEGGNKTTEQQQQQQGSSEQQQQQAGNEGGEQQQQQQQKGTATEEPKGPGGIRGHIEGIKTDITQFPDIYNWQNMLSLAFFTIFCLSSTGTQVEANWWLDHWAIDWDSYKRPWTILFHSLHMNNFLSMIFAILVLHNSLHPLVHGLAGGSAALMQYCGLVSLLSGIAMWGFNYVYYSSGEGAVDVATGKPIRGEKQFGPWDIAAAVLLMQYLRLGIAPHRFLLSFNGWVKYACCVGAVCIVYYDPQPVLCGTLLGYAFCRFAPAFRPIAAKV